MFERSPEREESFIVANYRATITPLIGPRFYSLFCRMYTKLNRVVSSFRYRRISTILITILFQTIITLDATIVGNILFPDEIETFFSQSSRFVGVACLSGSKSQL